MSGMMAVRQRFSPTSVLMLPMGEMLVITGPNGGGKSTLAKLLMGINEATSGRIILNGEDITDLSINERAQAASDSLSSSRRVLKA